MRKKIVAGNWKMNTNLQEGIELAKAVAAKSVETPENVGLIVAAPFTHLCAVAEAVKGSKVEVSAQNCADHEKGAYTGEVSVGMLTSVGCQWTILGHSERRQYYGETDEKLVEIVELPKDVHPWFVGVQFHPEFKSRPNRPHPLFAGLVGAACTGRDR